MRGGGTPRGDRAFSGGCQRSEAKPGAGWRRGAQGVTRALTRPELGATSSHNSSRAQGRRDGRADGGGGGGRRRSQGRGSAGSAAALGVQRGAALVPTGRSFAARARRRRECRCESDFFFSFAEGRFRHGRGARPDNPAKKDGCLGGATAVHHAFHKRRTQQTN